MLEFGKSLRTARETKGLSLSQVAESTHMLSQIVDGLEREDFSHIVAPIYGRGFVKLYCEAVGLEPQPFIDQFMALYGHTGPQAEAKQPVAPAPAPQAPDLPHPEPARREPFSWSPRIVMVAAAACVVLILLALGLRALYHATAVSDCTAEAVAEPATPAPAETPAETPAAAGPRTPLPVKPFYAD